MQTVGLIAEYNPFHLGHAYQIAQIRDAIGPKGCLMVMMSGSFCQRGIPACIGQEARAKAAMDAGADLLLLLPTVFATAEARSFAKGAVNALLGTGVLDALYAGAEAPMEKEIQALAQLIHDQQEAIAHFSKAAHKQGFSPNRAEAMALANLGVPQNLRALLDAPNLRLALAYQLALNEAQSSVPLYLTKRSGEAGDPLYLSASMLREQLKGPLKDYGRLRPWLSPSVLASLAQAKKQLLFKEAWDHFASLRLWGLDLSDLQGYRGMHGGLAERLSSQLRQHDSLSLVEGTATRNFTRARIRRALFSVAIGLKEKAAKTLAQAPAFLFPLAMNRRGQAALKAMRRKASLPVFGSFAAMEREEEASLAFQVRMERQAYVLRSYLTQEPAEGLLAPPQQCRQARPSF